MFATDAVPGKAASQPLCREDTGNKEGIVLPTEMDGSENAQESTSLRPDTPLPARYFVPFSFPFFFPRM